LATTATAAAAVAISERPDMGRGDLREALWGISAVIPDSSLDAWNNADGRTRADVLQMLARAEHHLHERPPTSNGDSRHEH
jgi:hypothetical protein